MTSASTPRARLTYAGWLSNAYSPWFSRGRSADGGAAARRRPHLSARPHPDLARGS